MSSDRESNRSAPPEGEGSETNPAGREGARFYVDGNLIKCGKVVSLPQVCVQTGDREDLALIQKRIVFVPFLCYLAGLWGVVPGIVLYFIMRRVCSANYFLSRSLRNKLRWRTFLGVTGILLTAGVMVMGAIQNDSAPVYLIGFAILVFSVTMLIRGSTPMKIAKENGTTFWLKGAKPEFFDELRRMYNA